MKSDFASRLQAAMDLRNMNQLELSRKTGVSNAAISRYINNERTPNADFVRAASAALAVTSDYLLGIALHPQGQKIPVEIDGEQMEVEVLKDENVPDGALTQEEISYLRDLIKYHRQQNEN